VTAAPARGEGAQQRRKRKREQSLATEPAPVLGAVQWANPSAYKKAFRQESHVVVYFDAAWCTKQKKQLEAMGKPGASVRQRQQLPAQVRVRFCICFSMQLGKLPHTSIVSKCQGCHVFSSSSYCESSTHEASAGQEAELPCLPAMTAEPRESCLACWQQFADIGLYCFAVRLG